MSAWGAVAQLAGTPSDAPPNQSPTMAAPKQTAGAWDAVTQAAGSPQAETQPSAPQEPEGYFHSLASSIGLDPEAIAQTGESFFRHPIQTAGEVASQAGTEIAKPIRRPRQTGKEVVSSVYQLFNPEAVAIAQQHLGQPGTLNKILGTEEYAESAIPMLGGTIAKAQEQAASGNWRGAAGTLTGIVAGLVATHEGGTAAPEGATLERPETAEPKPAPNEVNPEQFIYREAGPAPQHGTPVKVASPLDNATINKLPGGKDLSPEAVETLKKHIGGTPGKEIEVGSTPKNTLLKSVHPVQETIANTGSKMNSLVENAPEFEKSIKQSRKFGKTVSELRQQLPGGDEERLNKAIDKEVENAQEAINTTNPQTILSYRRKLGSQINWNDIPKNPETPGEVQNVAKARIYKVFTDKLHEIPGMLELDKTFQPNLELQSHLDAKLGETVSRNPPEANAQRQSELAKGKNQLDTEKYNETVRKNRQLAGLPDSDIEPTVKPTGGTGTAVDQSLDKAVSKFNVAPTERVAIRKMLQPSVKAGKLFGTNTSWYDALQSFDKLTPEQRAARFADPASVRNVLRQEAKKQVLGAVVKYGTAAAVAHALGVDRAVLRTMLGD